MPIQIPVFCMGEIRSDGYHPNRGPLTGKGFHYLVECVEAMKDVLGDEVGLALYCGPGMTVPDAMRFAQAPEPLNILWWEDMITGDYTPDVLADLYRQVTKSTAAPIHTGEQISLRENFVDLIENNAIRVIGPDPCDVGGIAEHKMDRGICRFAWHSHGPTRVGMACLAWLPWSRFPRRCRQTISPLNIPSANLTSGMTTYKACRIQSLKMAVSRDKIHTPGMGVDLIPEATRPYLLKGVGVFPIDLGHPSKCETSNKCF
jgi:L-alanine-DL-glutamate epimerase-like enolase superfamily enzyme